MVFIHCAFWQRKIQLLAHTGGRMVAMDCCVRVQGHLLANQMLLNVFGTETKPAFGRTPSWFRRHSLILPPLISVLRLVAALSVVEELGARVRASFPLQVLNAFLRQTT